MHKTPQIHCPFIQEERERERERERETEIGYFTMTEIEKQKK
jgi:hypothetical protein